MSTFFDEYAKLKAEQAASAFVPHSIFSVDTSDALTETTDKYMQQMRSSKMPYAYSGYMDSFKQLDMVSPEARNPHRLSAGGLFTPGMNILAGDPKVGKTTFLAQLLLSIASGRPILDLFDVVQMKCALIELEETED
jgi:RecA-family ATPase